VTDVALSLWFGVVVFTSFITLAAEQCQCKLSQVLSFKLRLLSSKPDKPDQPCCNSLHERVQQQQKTATTCQAQTDSY